MSSLLNLGTRTCITAAILLGGIVLLHSASRQKPVPLHAPLRDFPVTLAHWQGVDQPLTDETIKAVAVDEYVNRIYSDNSKQPVQLYIGYYKSQATGDTIHSPKNCLPGSGWDPVSTGRVLLTAPDGKQLSVNEYIVEKGIDRDVVLYWYQSRGRVIASEYSAKAWMALDALNRGRTDGALVRIITPQGGDMTAARARAVAFAEVMYPHLGEFVPN
jgi:EpsI family protein